jgi:ABC-type multidrug transport system fused ATPase/permease subunit
MSIPMSKQSTPHSNLMNAWKVLKTAEHRKAIFLSFLLLISVGLEILSLGLIMPLISLLSEDGFADKHPVVVDWLGNPSEFGLVVWAFSALTAVFILKSVFVAWTIWFQRGFSSAIEYRLSKDLFSRYLNHDYLFHVVNNSSELVRNVGMASQFSALTVDSVLVLATDGAVLVAIVGFFMFVEPVGTICVLLVLTTIGSLFHQISKSHISRWGNARIAHDGLKIKYMQEGFGAIKDVKVFGVEKFFESRFDEQVKATTHIGRAYGTVSSLPRIWLELLTFLALAVLVIVLVGGGNTLASTLPVLGVFAAGSFRVMPSLNRIIFAVQNLKYSESITKTLSVDLADSSSLMESSQTIWSLETEVKFTDVSFCYPGVGESALNNVSLEFKKGNIIGLIGTSGAGKSTIVDLLLGLFPPTSGSITANDVDIQSGLKRWREQIGYVPQNIYLIDDTLARNIAFGLMDEDIDGDKIDYAISNSALQQFVETLPLGLETVVGERGVRLSGGQRQRIGIARALYRNPHILVLDEATSALDIDTESAILNEISELRENRTIIIVAHRLSSLSFCNVVYRLEKGAVHSSGDTQVVSAWIREADVQQKEKGEQ